MGQARQDVHTCAPIRSSAGRGTLISVTSRRASAALMLISWRVRCGSSSGTPSCAMRYTHRVRPSCHAPLRGSASGAGAPAGTGDRSKLSAIPRLVQDRRLSPTSMLQCNKLEREGLRTEAVWRSKTFRPTEVVFKRPAASAVNRSRKPGWRRTSVRGSHAGILPPTHDHVPI